MGGSRQGAVLGSLRWDILGSREGVSYFCFFKRNSVRRGMAALAIGLGMRGGGGIASGTQARPEETQAAVLSVCVLRRERGCALGSLLVSVRVLRRGNNTGE